LEFGRGLRLPIEFNDSFLDLLLRMLIFVRIQLRPHRFGWHQKQLAVIGSTRAGFSRQFIRPRPR
jgi:hypothetical protein